jgi:multidrug efflux pump
LKNPDEFARIVLKANTDGSSVTLGDVARVELGAQSYAMSTRENGRGVGAIGVQLAPGANAVATANAVEARMKDLARAMPPGMEWHVPFTTAPFVTVSIEKVVHTLIEAMVLVFLVMYLFLQNIRYTLIPAIVAPIALLGTLGVMWVTGFSINVLTMFGMVLAIGIIVDDAIVVVENVERLMVEEGLPPREATQKAMKEITGAVIGITLVLVAVFLPMALANGSVGAIYRQFTLSMAVSILFSAFLALSLTPALCATLLKPVSGHAAKNRFFAAFDRGFERMTGGYERWVGALLKRGGRAMLVLAAMVGLLGVAYANLPSAFLPEEDQGYFITSFQLPADATAARTSEAMKVLERHVAQRPGIETNEAVMGFGFSGSGPNAAMAFTVLRDWNQRHGTTITDEIARATQALRRERRCGDEPDAARHRRTGQFGRFCPAAGGPWRPGTGRSGGGAISTPRHGGAKPQGRRRLPRWPARGQQHPPRHRPTEGAGAGCALFPDQRHAVGGDGLDLCERFPEQGTDAAGDRAGRYRQPHAVGRLAAPQCPQCRRGMVPLSEVVTPRWGQTPLQLVRYNGYPRCASQERPHPACPAAMPCARWRRWLQNCRVVSRWNGRVSPCRKTSPPRRRPCCWHCRWRWCSWCWRPCMKAGPFRSR